MTAIAGLAAGIARMMTENMYKKGLLEKRKRRLLSQFKRSAVFHFIFRFYRQKPGAGP